MTRGEETRADEQTRGRARAFTFRAEDSMCNTAGVGPAVRRDHVETTLGVHLVDAEYRTLRARRPRVGGDEARALGRKPMGSNRKEAFCLEAATTKLRAVRPEAGPPRAARQG